MGREGAVQKQLGTPGMPPFDLVEIPLGNPHCRRASEPCAKCIGIVLVGSVNNDQIKRKVVSYQGCGGELSMQS